MSYAKCWKYTMQREWEPGLDIDNQDGTTRLKPTITNCVVLSSSAINVAIKVAKKVAKTKEVSRFPKALQSQHRYDHFEMTPNFRAVCDSISSFKRMCYYKSSFWAYPRGNSIFALYRRKGPYINCFQINAYLKITCNNIIVWPKIVIILPQVVI